MVAGECCKGERRADEQSWRGARPFGLSVICSGIGLGMKIIGEGRKVAKGRKGRAADGCRRVLRGAVGGNNGIC